MLRLLMFSPFCLRLNELSERWLRILWMDKSRRRITNTAPQTNLNDNDNPESKAPIKTDHHILRPLGFLAFDLRVNDENERGLRIGWMKKNRPRNTITTSQAKMNGTDNPERPLPTSNLLALSDSLHLTSGMNEANESWLRIESV